MLETILGWLITLVAWVFSLFDLAYNLAWWALGLVWDALWVALSAMFWGLIILAPVALLLAILAGVSAFLRYRFPDKESEGLLGPTRTGILPWVGLSLLVFIFPLTICNAYLSGCLGQYVWGEFSLCESLLINEWTGYVGYWGGLLIGTGVSTALAWGSSAAGILSLANNEIQDPESPKSFKATATVSGFLCISCIGLSVLAMSAGLFAPNVFDGNVLGSSGNAKKFVFSYLDEYGIPTSWEAMLVRDELDGATFSGETTTITAWGKVIGANHVSFHFHRGKQLVTTQQGYTLPYWMSGNRIMVDVMQSDGLTTSLKLSSDGKTIELVRFWARSSKESGMLTRTN